MSDLFGDTVQKSHQWLKEIAAELQADEGVAYCALRATLHGVRDRLPVDDAVKLAAHLPMLLRGLYFEGWKPHEAPQRLHLEDLLNRIGEECPHRTEEADRLGRAALCVLSRHSPPSVVQHVRHLLPEDLRSFWDSAMRARDRDELLEKASAVAAEWP